MLKRVFFLLLIVCKRGFLKLFLESKAFFKSLCHFTIEGVFLLGVKDVLKPRFKRARLVGGIVKDSVVFNLKVSL